MHAAKTIYHSPEGAQTLETVFDNVFWAGCAPRLSIVIPSYRHDASNLIDQLARCVASPLAEIIVYDDGSRDHSLLASMQEAASSARAAVRIVSCPVNRGRAAARNAAIAHARAAWILLLDADMAPESANFIETYLEAEEKIDHPALVVGGYSLRFAQKNSQVALHRWQAETSECVPAEVRRKAPGRYVFSANVMVHREVLESRPFDERFEGWGWEDTDWGLRAEQAFPIMHIDNPATHLGLDDDKSLMAKYAKSGENFARMAANHPEQAAEMPLYKAAIGFKRWPLLKLFRAIAGGLAAVHLLPTGLRGRFLKVWRAMVYAEAL
ncbi:MAG: glycosyltransferase [Hyphomonadaceae bacterium]|nr:glycosyltransferase [Hyphomonadaceae bacterium]